MDKKEKEDMKNLLCLLDGKISMFRISHFENEVDHSEITDIQNAIVFYWKALQ